MTLYFIKTSQSFLETPAFVYSPPFAFPRMCWNVVCFVRLITLLTEITQHSCIWNWQQGTATVGKQVAQGDGVWENAFENTGKMRGKPDDHEGREIEQLSSEPKNS